MRTIFGLFDDHRSAKQAAEAVEKAGFSEKQISVLTRPDKAKLAALRKSAPDNDFYVDRVERDGSTLVIVECEEGKASKAGEILARHGMVDVRRRMEDYAKAQGKEGSLRGDKDSDQVLKVVEERLQVGKRDVERGKVRVFNRITSKEVEEKVGLRHETIHVQRRPIDQPVEADAIEELFRERSFEVREIHEEPVVNKVARVLEEVVVSKDVAERMHTIRDTIRRSDVEVEHLHAHRAFEEYDRDLHDYYAQSLAKTGHKYDEYLPAFKFGYSLGTSDQAHELAWTEVESGAQRTWEQSNPGTWSTYKAAIHHAFDAAHN
jgi:uncharacterized protein (TIGR02271 family)